MLIIPTSPGIEHFPTSTQKLSMTMFITPEQQCATGVTASHFFSVDFTQSGGGSQEYFTVYIECSTPGTIRFGSSTYSSAFAINSIFPSGASSLALLLSIDLSVPFLRFELRSDTVQMSNGRPLDARAKTLTFDSNTKLYLCANKDGTPTQTCTVSQFTLEYRYYEASSFPYAHLDGNPAVAAFYPLSGGSLATSMGSASSAYFGDDETNPAEATKPTWDSSKSFVTISAGQFLTFPLPSISSTLPATANSFSFSAWVKILTEIPATTTTIFAMYSSTGGQVGYYLTVDQSTRKLTMAFKPDSQPLTPVGTAPTITLDTWQLIGFTASSNTDQKSVAGTVFCGTSWYNFQRARYTSAYDLSAASVIRVGDASSSFNGHISVVRIITPGGGFVRSTDVCASENSIELGTGSFALACSGNNILSSVDNKCYSSCPSGTHKFTDTATSLCLTCSEHCTECNAAGCSVCEAGYLKNEGGCVKPCPEKTYSDGVSCRSCSDTTCKTCDNSKCLTCESGDVLNEGSCVNSCPDKTYPDGDVCQSCSDDNCKKCNNVKCLTCDSSYLLSEGGCVKSCPDKTYSDGETCQSCSTANCKKCNTDKCLTCDSSYLLSQGECVKDCLDKTYSDGEACQSCSDTNCKKCESSSKCITCETSFFEYEGGCVDSCPGGTYSDGKACQSCSTANCNNCDNTQCLTCEKSFALYKGECVSCPDGTYTDGEACQSCSDNNCKKCESSSKCLTCKTDFFEYQGGCVDSCPGGTYSDGEACQSCSDTNCKKCEKTKCSSCNTNYLLNEGGCVDSCPAKSYSDGTSCIACSEYCIECNADGCNVCDEGHELDNDKKCGDILQGEPWNPPTEEARSSSASRGGISGGVIGGIVGGSIAIISLAGWAFYSFKMKKFPFRPSKSAPKIRYLENQIPSGVESSSPVSLSCPTSPINSEERRLFP